MSKPAPMKNSHQKRKHKAGDYSDDARAHHDKCNRRRKRSNTETLCELVQARPLALATSTTTLTLA